MRSFLNCIYVRQKRAGCWGYVVRCWVVLKTDEGKTIRLVCYSPGGKVLAVVATEVDNRMSTAHP